MRGSRGDHAAESGRWGQASQHRGKGRPALATWKLAATRVPCSPRPAGQAEGPPCPPTARSEGRSHGGRAEAAATPLGPGSLPPAQGPRSTPEF